ncbi:COG4-domain-containing protein [Punctularia strigosozonata HHB-11173 SS5]|uniref:COG4-domain-containing protein n=1 Tax=Punctularia strigosozonata (strain HHB-11173) TaxID=741275 RepID=UPI0004417496|nr:COG4-domain-containing protein [Punctularia strigosozonata HHB-11173 SS5]EIN07598.1 COG4-domain-containing protein [Punctularia strigosozonata HHB-11173 SS5]
MLDATDATAAASLKTLPEILSALSNIDSEETELSTSLAGLVAAQEPIIAAVSRLQALTPHLDALNGEASLLDDRVSKTAGTAMRVGGRVRQLDKQMHRVQEAAERVGQVMDLKSSLAELRSSMERKDWEAASRHCARAMHLPPDVISGPFAEKAVPSSEDPRPPAQALQAAREELLEVFRREFQAASALRDAVATSRFFKLFPTIGWETEGLDAYAAFVVDLVRVRPPPSAKPSSPLYYTTVLTALFESIAIIIDQHQPVVEKYYGAGKMTLVIRRLLEECDRISIGLLDNWKEQRSIERKLAETSTSPFALTSHGLRKPPHQVGAAMTEDDTLDGREIDQVITEVATMAGRWSLFRKFLINRLQEELEEDSDSTSQDGERAKPSKSSQQETSSSVALQASITALDSSATRQSFDKLLETCYIPLELWYIRTVIDKAHHLAKADITSMPATTTAPDDVFFVLKIVMQRTLSTGSPRNVLRTCELLREVMDYDYASVIKRKLDDVYRTAVPSSGSRGEKTERDLKASFITLLNDLDVSSSHMDRLVRDILGSTAIEQGFIDQEADDVRSTISQFSSLVPKFRATLRAGVEQLFNQLVRPKLRTFLADVYKDVTYVLDEESYAAAEYQEVVKKRFIKNLDLIITTYKEMFTENNFGVFFVLLLDILIRPWEKQITMFRYNELGAIRLDRDLRAVLSWMSGQTVSADVREKFTRLQQISILLNLDNDEDVEDFYNGSGIQWKLSAEEAQAISALKT